MAEPPSSLASEDLAGLHFTILRQGVRAMGWLLVVTSLLMVLGAVLEQIGTVGFGPPGRSPLYPERMFEATLTSLIGYEFWAALIVVAGALWWSSRRKQILTSQREWALTSSRLNPEEFSRVVSTRVPSWGIHQARMKRSVGWTGALLSLAVLLYFTFPLPIQPEGFRVPQLGPFVVVALGIVVLGPLALGLIAMLSQSEADRAFWNAASVPVRRSDRRRPVLTGRDAGLHSSLVKLETSIRELSRLRTRSRALLDRTILLSLVGAVLAVADMAAILAGADTPGVSAAPFANAYWLDTEVGVLVVGLAAAVLVSLGARPRTTPFTAPLSGAPGTVEDEVERALQLVQTGPRVIDETRRSGTVAILLGMFSTLLLVSWTFSVVLTGYVSLVYWGSGAWTLAAPATSLALGLLLLLLLSPIPLLVGLIVSVTVQDESAMLQELRVRSAADLVGGIDTESILAVGTTDGTVPA